MDVYWLERSAADLPAQNDWLSASDRTRLDGMRFAKRREDWRLGRWTAKLAVAAYLNLPTAHQALAKIEVLPAPSGAPEVFLANQPAGITISLSHRDGTAICAVADSGVALGCDLEIVEPRSDAFVSDYFTPEEQALVAKAHPADRFLLLALLWSTKESALKALRTGLRLDTRSVVVNLVDGFGSPGKTFRAVAKLRATQHSSCSLPAAFGARCKFASVPISSFKAGGSTSRTSCEPWSPLHPLRSQFHWLSNNPAHLRECRPQRSYLSYPERTKAPRITESFNCFNQRSIRRSQEISDAAPTLSTLPVALPCAPP